MRKKIILIVLITFFLIAIFILIGNIGNSYHDQWCTNCGHIRHIEKKCYGFFCKITYERIDENYFSKYWEKTHGECKEHSWRNYHGGFNFLLSKGTYSGYKPAWWGWDIRYFPSDYDYLGFLYSFDPALVKELLEHMLELEKERILNRQYPASEQNQEFWKKSFIGFRNSPPNESDFQRFKEWWESYKEKYQQ